MGNRIQYDYTALRDAALGVGDAASALIPEVPYAAAEAVGQVWETRAAPTMAAPTDFRTLAASATPHYAQRSQAEQGVDQATASAQAQNLEDAMAVSASDGKLEVTSSGVDIPNLDQFLTHTRDVAAGRHVENVSRMSNYLTDLQGVGAAFGSTWGALQQGWFGYRIGEPWKDILHRRIWPETMVKDSEGNTESKAVVLAAAEMAWERTAVALGDLSPLMLLPGYRERQTERRERARANIRDITQSDWYQNLLTGRDVMEYNIAGYGRQLEFGAGPDVGGVEIPMFPIGMETMLPLPPAGTPERASVDNQVISTMDAFYADAVGSVSGRATMAGVVFGGLASDFVEDPLLPIGDAAPELVNLGRKALAVSSRARGTAAIALHSGGLDDTARALDDAVAWVESATKNAARAKGDEAVENANLQLAQAQRNLVRIRAQSESFAQGTAEQMLVTQLPQANPRIIARVGRTYLESNPEQAPERAMTLLRNMQREADMRVSIVERRLGTPVAGDDPALFQEHLKLARREQEEVAKTTEWLESKLENRAAGRLEGVFQEAITLDKPYEAAGLAFRPEDMSLTRDPEVVGAEILKNIRRGVANKAPEEELMQWELTYRMLQDETITPQQALQRVTAYSGDQILQQDIKSARLSAQKKIPDHLSELTVEDEPATVWNRITAGPDAGEQAGNAAAKLAAGADLDDVSVRAMTVDTYLNSFAQRPQARLGMEDAKNVWLGEDAFKTTREAADWQRSMWERMSDFFMPGLYPEVYNWRPTAGLARLRETGWALESVNPRLMRRLENALAAQEFETHRMLGFFEAEFRHLGIFDDTVKGGKLLRRKVDAEKARQFGYIMNQVPDSPEYVKAMSKLTPGQMRSVRRMREMFDFVGDKQGLRNTDRRLVGYITNVLDDSDFPAGTLDPVWQGVPADETIFQPFLEARMADPTGVDIDITQAVDRYVRAASKKIHMEPVVAELREASAAAVAADPRLSWFPSYANDLIDVLKGRPSVLGSLVENQAANQAAWRRSAQMLGQTADDPVRGLTDRIVQIPEGMAPVSTKIRERVHGAVYTGSTLAYMGALTGNRRYFPMTVTTGLATSGARWGMWRQLEGILKLGDPTHRKLFEATGLNRHFYKLLDPGSGTDAAKLIQKVSEIGANVPFGAPSINFSENVIRGWAFNAGLSELMTRTGYSTIDEVAQAGLLNSYIAEAAFATQNINHRFGALGRPPWMRRISESGTTALTQFLTFPYKQLETISWLSRKNPGYLARYMAFSGALTRFGNSLGVDLGQYVSVPGVSDFDTKSIMTEIIGSSLTVANETSKNLNGSGNPQDLHMAMQRLGEQTQNLSPLMNAFKSWAKSTRQIVTGEERRAGQLTRELDMGMFEWNDELSVAENLSYIPLGFFDEGGGFSTDMASILTGLRSTEANLEKAQYDGAVQALQNSTYMRRLIADQLDYAIETGDDREFNRVLERALEEGVMPPDLKRVSQNAVYNHALPRLLRLQANQTEQVVEVLEAIRAASPYER